MHFYNVRKYALCTFLLFFDEDDDASGWDGKDGGFYKGAFVAFVKTGLLIGVDHKVPIVPCIGFRKVEGKVFPVGVDSAVEIWG